MYTRIDLTFTVIFLVPDNVDAYGVGEGSSFIESLACVLSAHALQPISAGGVHEGPYDRLAAVYFTFVDGADARACGEALDGAASAFAEWGKAI